MTTDDLLDAYPTAVAEHARTLMRLVRALMPDALERVYPGWRGIGYVDPDAGYVCGVFPRNDAVRLLFEHGASLPDPEGELMGDGTQTRYLEFGAGTSVDEATVARWIARALNRRACEPAAARTPSVTDGRSFSSSRPPRRRRS